MMPSATLGTDADFSLRDRRALVTGGARGIGAAIARRFVASGAKVTVTHLADPVSVDAVEKLGEELGARNFLALVADASDSEAMHAAMGRAAEAFGPLDTLVINAADVAKKPWDEISIGEWDAMMAVNLRGAFVAALHAVPQMRRGGYGKIVTVGSVMATFGDPRSLHYVTSKQGLIGFTRSLARAEGKSGIRVNCVVPGAIATERHFEEGGTLELGRLADMQSVQRRGFADDIAASCQFLASAAADFISGQVLTVDGGWTNY
jgi:3-oxoacyl-[acyl-carrier protein] reductase